MTETSPRRRAPAMDPEQRRAMIVAAALPLVVEYGAAVTTAKIARAAGIGEGTIFRVFPDKETLLGACMAEVLRPDDVVAQLNSISLDQPLAARLTEASEAMRAFLTRMGAVAGALHGIRSGQRAEASPAAAGGTGPDSGSAGSGAAGASGPPPDREAGLAAPRGALADLFEPERARLRLSPERLADTFQLLVMTSGRPGAPQPLSTDELVDLFLHGALLPEAETEAGTEAGTEAEQDPRPPRGAKGDA